MANTTKTVTFEVKGQAAIDKLTKSLGGLVTTEERLTKATFELDKVGRISSVIVEKQEGAYKKLTETAKLTANGFEKLAGAEKVVYDVEKQLLVQARERARGEKNRAAFLAKQSKDIQANAKVAAATLEKQKATLAKQVAARKKAYEQTAIYLKRQARIAIEQAKKEQDKRTALVRKGAAQRVAAIKKASVAHQAAATKQIAAQDKIASNYNKFKGTFLSGNKAMTISWQALGRIVGIQILYRAFNQLTRLLSESMQTYLEFSTRIGEIQTISQKTGITTAQWADQIRDLSDAFGADILDVAEAHYEAISNQIAKGTTALGFMIEAQKLAISTVSSLANAVDATSSILNAFNMHSSQTASIGAILFKTVDLGRIRLNEMASTLGRASVTSHALGISFLEQQAAISTLTIQGMEANTAITLLNNIMLKMIKPTDTMKEKFKEWGVASGAAAFQAFGVEGVLRKIEMAAKDGGDELEEIGKMFGRLRAITGKVALPAGKFEEAMEKFKDAEEEYAVAHEKIMETVGKRWEITINKIKNFFTTDLSAKIWATMDKWAGSIENVVPLVKGLVNTVISLGKAFVFYTIGLKAVSLGLFLFRTATALATARTLGFKAALHAATVGTVTLGVALKTLATVGVAAVFTAAVLIYDYYSRAYERIQESASVAYDKMEAMAEKFSVARGAALRKSHAEFKEILNDQFRQYFLLYTSISKISNDAANNIAHSFKQAQDAVMAGWKIVAARYKEQLKEMENALKKSNKNIEKIQDMRKGIKHVETKEVIAKGVTSNIFADQERAVLVFQQAQVEGLVALQAGDAITAEKRFKQAEEYFKYWNDQVDKAKKIGAPDKAEADIIKAQIDQLSRRIGLLQGVNKAFQRNQLKEERSALQSKLVGSGVPAKGSDIGRLHQAQLGFINKIREEQKKALAEAEVANRVQAEALANELKKQKEINSYIESRFKKLSSIDLDAKDVDKDALFDRAVALEQIRIKLKEVNVEDVDVLTRRLEIEQKIQLEMEKQTKEAKKILDDQKKLKDIKERVLTIDESVASTTSERDIASRDVGKAFTAQISQIRGFYSNLTGGEIRQGAKSFNELAKSIVATEQATNAYNKQPTEEKLKLMQEALGNVHTLMDNFSRVSGVDDPYTSKKGGELFLKNTEAQRKAFETLVPAQHKLNVAVEAQVEAQKDLLRIQTELDKAAGGPEAMKALAASADVATSGITSLHEAIKKMLNDVAPRISKMRADFDAMGGVIPGVPGGAGVPAKHLASGGPVGTDTIPAWLSPGEYVWDAATTKKWAPLIKGLHQAPKYMAGGGSVTNVGDISVSVMGGDNSAVTARGIATQLRREIRRGTLSLG